MNLTHERFLKVIGSLVGTDALESEQRGAPRVSLRAQVMIAPLDDARFIDGKCLRIDGSEPEPGPAYAVRIQDLSEGGIALLHFHGLPKGKPFILELPEKQDAGRIVRTRMLCRVMHSRVTAEHQHLIGAKFVRAWTNAAPTLDAAVTLAA